MTVPHQLRRALTAGVVAYAGLWAFLEPLTWLGLIPSPSTLIRLLYFPVAFLVAALWYVYDSRRLPAAETTPPALRVRVKPGFVQHPSIGTRDVIHVVVQNVSSHSVFLAAVTLTMVYDRAITLGRDCITGEWLYPRELRPGESFTIRCDPHGLLEGRTPDSFEYAVARDAVDLEYRSEQYELSQALRAAMRA